VKVLTCPICGTVRVGVPRHRQACSRVCAQALMKQRHGADWHRRIGHKAGLGTALAQRKRTDALWGKRWPEVPPAIARAIYKQGYNSGWLAGSRHGEQVYVQARRTA
jgi:hypothetical protein